MSLPAPAPAPASASSTPSPLPEGELREGARGADVQRLQEVLVALKFLKARPDGDFGPRTKAALGAFQREWGLVANGVYDAGTRAALLKARVPVYKPKVVSKPSPNHEPRRGTKIDVIVLHHTGSNRASLDLAILRQGKGSNRVSSHYLIAPDGTLYQLVRDDRAAWHAGVSSLRGETKPSVNLRSLGIELTNDGTPETPFTEAQYRVLEKLVPYLARTYRVPKENIVGHRDVAPGRKVDPSDNFDWARVRLAVDAVL